MDLLYADRVLLAQYKLFANITAENVDVSFATETATQLKHAVLPTKTRETNIHDAHLYKQSV